MQKNKPIKVSVVIRGKNEASWLKVLLRELKKQTFQNFEIIFCDNQSSDNTIEILKKFDVKKIFRLKNYKPGLALNKSVLLAKGVYTVFVSSHCVPENKRWLENFVNFMDKNPNVSAAYGKQIPLPGSNSQNSLDLNILFRDEDIVHHKDPYISNANSIYITNRIKKYKFDPYLSNIEDRVWAKEEIKRKGKIAYLSKAAVFHLHGIHQHLQSTNRSITTFEILNKNITKLWKKCFFLKPEYFEYSILINARRETKSNNIKNKIKNLIQSNFYNDFKIKKIIVITDINFKMNNCIIVKPKKTLEEDLKNIYSKFKKDWITSNYVLILNTTVNWNLNKVQKLIRKTIYLSKPSGTFYEEYDGNFIVNFPDYSSFKSIDLIQKQQKPKLKLMKWTNGCLIDPDYLRRGIYVDNNTYMYLM